MIKKLLPFVFLLFIALASNSCCGETTWMNQGEIIGRDARKCAHPCCGGYWIEIEGERYRFFDLPENCDVEINSQTVFPIFVNINWSPNTDGCGGDQIFVNKIKKQ